MSNYTIRAFTKAEQLYAYRQSQQIAGQTGFYGYYHGDFGKRGDDYNAVWINNNANEMTDDFRNDLADVMKTLGENGQPLFDRNAMQEYCRTNPDSHFKGTFGYEYGFRLKTDKYSYIIRMEPFCLGDYDFYIFAYDTRLLDNHIKNASKGINFITSAYKHLFNLEDGDSIIVQYADGERKVKECRFIDEYHTQIDKMIYHNCQFAEIIERNGATVIPYRKSLPYKAFHYNAERKKIEIAAKGEDKVKVVDAPSNDDEKNREYVNERNKEFGADKKQVAAMMVGSILGWDDKGADPRNYDDDGKFIKNAKHKDTPER